MEHLEMSVADFMSSFPHDAAGDNNNNTLVTQYRSGKMIETELRKDRCRDSGREMGGREIGYR